MLHRYRNVITLHTDHLATWTHSDRYLQACGGSLCNFLDQTHITHSKQVCKHKGSRSPAGKSGHVHRGAAGAPPFEAQRNRAIP